MTEFESVKYFLNHFYDLLKIKTELDYFCKNGYWFSKKICKSSRKAKKLLADIKKAESVVFDTINKLEPIEKDVITEFIIKNKSRYTVIIDNYISEATLYRILNKTAFIIYKKILINNELQKNFFYVINYLQN